VLDSTIHYQDTGSGTAAVLLHGNPGFLAPVAQTLFPIWVGGAGCWRPDLIGMGRLPESPKLSLQLRRTHGPPTSTPGFDALDLDRVNPDRS